MCFLLHQGVFERQRGQFLWPMLKAIELRQLSFYSLAILAPVFYQLSTLVRCANVLPERADLGYCVFMVADDNFAVGIQHADLSRIVGMYKPSVQIGIDG